MINKWLIITIVSIVVIGYFTEKIIPFKISTFSVRNVNSIEATGWAKNQSRSVLDYIKLKNTSALITPRDFCTVERILLHIFVITAPDRILQRQTIRNTWGNIDNFNYDKFKFMHQKAKGTYLEINYKNWKDYIYENQENINQFPSNVRFRIKITFLMGKTVNPDLFKVIKNESDTFNDILMEDFIDHYTNMTLKSVAMLKWGTSICKENSKFIAKVDDDEFVVLPNLIHVLLGGTVPLYYDLMLYYNYKTINIMQDSNRLPSKNLLAGHAWFFSVPNRNPTHKYYTPYYLYDKIFFPTYLGGFMYFMSLDVAEKLFEGVFEIPLFHMEDIYITGMVAQHKNISLTKTNLLAFLPVNNLCKLKGLVSEQGRAEQEKPMVFHFFTSMTEECKLLDGTLIKYFYKIVYFMFEPGVSIVLNWLSSLMRY